ncbi:MAG: glycosyltransferase family 4 protein [Chloroflexi bacterium]|nr:glycosyltransferase family 4 protein [Chloroflexota bacterium]
MKIGLIIYGSLETISGGYMYDRKLVEYLRAQGDEVGIISLPWRNYPAHLMDNLSFRLPSQYDILIQDELNHPSLLAANLGKHSHPVISLVHHLRCSELRPAWQNHFYRLVEKKYLQHVDGFIFNSQTTCLVVRELSGRNLPETVAHPPTDRFGEAIPEQEIKARALTGELRIVFLGNLMERKGLHTLLRSVVGLKSKVRVDVIGSLTAEPEYVKRIRAMVEQNDLSSFVFLHDSLDNDPLAEILRQSHLMIVPSSYEGFGIVYLEGMGFGLPSIGTTAGAAGEIIEHGVTGYLIPPNDSPALAAYISALATNRELLTQLSLNARRRYIQQPSWMETAARVRAFLQSMIGQK